MPVFTAIAVYFIIWWVVLFAVLPFGVRSQFEDGEVTDGTEPGAPIAPRLLPKMLATSVVAAICMAGVYWAMSLDWLQAYWS